MALYTLTAQDLDYEYCLILNLLIHYPKPEGYTCAEIADTLKLDIKNKVRPRLKRLCNSRIVTESRREKLVPTQNISTSPSPYTYTINGTKGKTIGSSKLKEVVTKKLSFYNHCQKENYKKPPVQTPTLPSLPKLNSLQVNICRLLAVTTDYVDHSYIVDNLLEDCSLSQVTKAMKVLVDKKLVDRQKITKVHLSYCYKLRPEYLTTCLDRPPARSEVVNNLELLSNQFPAFNGEWSIEAQERWIRLYEKLLTGDNHPELANTSIK